MTVPVVRLRDHTAIPQIGFGTGLIDDSDAENLVAAAIRAGYRLVDTAEHYQNEIGVGRGIQSSGLPREEFYVCTKFDSEWHGFDLVRQGLERSLKRLAMDYVDLYLIHWPVPALDKFVDTWRGLIRLQTEGLVRAIGTSNFKVSHLNRLYDETGVLPSLNQIQLNPFYQRAAERQYHDAHGIVTGAWAPLGGNSAPVLSDPLISDIAGRYAKTPAQVVLRWHLQMGNIAVPKASSPLRVAENVDILDFELPDSEIALISSMDRGTAAVHDSDVIGH